MIDSVHWLDRAFSLALAPRLMFAGGWGDPIKLEQLSKPVPTEDSPAPIEIHWDQAETSRGIVRRTGTFTSPARDLLPQAADRAHIELLLPAAAATGRKPGVCIYLAASGEQTFIRRRFLAGPLLRRGIGALFLENPHYGRRRPAGQVGAFIRTVAEQLAMNRATVREARALLEWLRADGHWPLGVSGYSMGGHMSILTAARATFPVAAIPCAAGLSPAPVFTEGLLSRSIRWRALAAEQRDGEQAARERLRALLEQVAGFVSQAPKPKVAIIVAAKDDGIVLPREVRRLKEAWPEAELRWIEGGHVTGFLRAQSVMREAISDAMSRAGALG